MSLIFELFLKRCNAKMCESFKKLILFGYWLLNLKPMLISNEFEFGLKLITADYSNQEWNLPTRIPIRFGFYT